MRAIGHACGRIRLAAMLALGAFAVHQLRYALAFGDGSSGELAQRGHGYLGTLLPGLAVLGLAVLAATALGVLAGSRPRRTPIALRAAACAGVLLAIFAAQELLEWALAPGSHLSLAASLLGTGAWLALPLSAALGAALSLLLGGLEGIERVLAALLNEPARPPARPLPGKGPPRSPGHLASSSSRLRACAPAASVGRLTQSFE